MDSRDQNEFDLGLDPLPESPPPAKRGLTISPHIKQALSSAQVEFNKRMKALEKERENHQLERARLDRDLAACLTELMPAMEELNRAERDLLFAGLDAKASLKLTKKRQQWLDDLLSGKAAHLLADPIGLSPSDLDFLQSVVDQLGTSLMDTERKEQDREEFEELREFLEDMARQAGVDLDLSDIDIDGDPVEVERQLHERFATAGKDLEEAAKRGTASGKRKRKRKPSKAALERERLQQEVEQAKSRDLKSLYKQLAKVLHPDLEIDPVLKAHKENWMKRLNTAQANGDLRDMLSIEMEWLGEESGNLSTASDEKLRIYSMVLKEQLDDLREQTVMLIHEPQYDPLRRFSNALHSRRKPAIIKLGLLDETARLKEMIARLRPRNSSTQAMLNQWADAHARACMR